MDTIIGNRRGLGVSDLGQGKMESTSAAVDRAGLNPNRQRGFDANFPRIETPTLSDMRARQGAIVAKFLTFFQRKSSLVIELYNGVFYRQTPTWDKIADFVAGDLCTTAELRKEIKDVHPVKMLIFIKLSDDKYRGMLVDKLQSAEGVIWKDYGVKVKGYSLDAEVKSIKLLGVSPETDESDIKQTFSNLGIGEVMEIRKGLFDEKKATWSDQWGLENFIKPTWAAVV